MARGNFFYQRLGKRVYKERIKKKLSQEELSYLSCVDRTYITKIENGQANPSLKILYQVADSLNLKLHQLLNGV